MQILNRLTPDNRANLHCETPKAILVSRRFAAAVAEFVILIAILPCRNVGDQCWRVGEDVWARGRRRMGAWAKTYWRVGESVLVRWRKEAKIVAIRERGVLSLNIFVSSPCGNWLVIHSENLFDTGALL